MATAGLANDLPAIPDWYSAFSFAFCTDLACFYIDNGPSTIGMILHVILDQAFAFLASIGLTCGTPEISPVSRSSNSTTNFHLVRMAI